MIGILGKDLYNANHRILDHRIFVNGEIENFLNHFEVKRNDIEVATFFTITESVGELKYDLSERCINLGSSNLNKISDEIKQLLTNVEDFLGKTKEETSASESLLSGRQKREERKANFLKDLEHEFKRVDNSFEQKEEEIAELYSDLELKLNIPK